MNKTVQKTTAGRKCPVKIGAKDSIMGDFQKYNHENDMIRELSAVVLEHEDGRLNLELHGRKVSGTEESTGVFQLSRWNSIVCDNLGQLYEDAYACVEDKDGYFVRRPCSDEEARQFLLDRFPLLNRLFGSVSR